MTTITKPIITLKNLKHFEAGSQETNCYVADIYVDGIKFAYVENDGHGGCDNVTPIKGKTYADLRELEDRIKATFPKWGSEFSKEEGDNMDTTLEIVCGNLVTEFLIKKDFKKSMKKVCYYKKDDAKKDIYSMASKYKPTKEFIAIVKEKASWAKDVIFLHDLTEDQAFEIYNSAVR